MLYGVLAVGLAFMVSKFGGVLQASLAINGALSGPVLGVFSLGLFVPFANGKVRFNRSNAGIPYSARCVG